MTAQKPSIYGPFPTPDKAKPWKLGLTEAGYGVGLGSLSPSLGNGDSAPVPRNCLSQGRHPPQGSGASAVVPQAGGFGFFHLAKPFILRQPQQLSERHAG
jgi:hypothetical protein